MQNYQYGTYLQEKFLTAEEIRQWRQRCWQEKESWEEYLSRQERAWRLEVKRMMTEKIPERTEKMVEVINTHIAQELIGRNVFDQEDIDKALLRLDGTDDKSAFGTRTVFGVSAAVACAAAAALKLPLYRYLAECRRRVCRYLWSCYREKKDHGGRYRERHGKQNGTVWNISYPRRTSPVSHTD